MDDIANNCLRQVGTPLYWLNFELETGLSRKEQETARKLLKARGLLKEKFTRCPRRLEFWLDKDALNQRWSAFVSNIELPIQDITKAWTRKSKKAENHSNQTSAIMPNSSNIDKYWLNSSWCCPHDSHTPTTGGNTREYHHFGRSSQCNKAAIALHKDRGKSGSSSFLMVVSRHQ